MEEICEKLRETKINKENQRDVEGLTTNLLRLTGLRKKVQGTTVIYQKT